VEWFGLHPIRGKSLIFFALQESDTLRGEKSLSLSPAGTI
jgi:hypothetical protein